MTKVRSNEGAAHLTLPPPRRSGSVGRGATWPFLFLAVLLAGLIPGWLTATLGLSFVAVVAVVVGGSAMLLRPILGIYVLVLFLPIESLLRWQGMTIARLVGIAVLGVWLLRELWTPAALRRWFSMELLLPLAAFIGYAALSITWAEFPQVTLILFSTLAQLLGLSLLVVAGVGSWLRVERIVLFLMLGALIAAMVTLGQYAAFAAPDYRAGGGVTGGTNETGTTLAILLPFGFYFWSRARRWVPLGLAYLVLGSTAIVTTFSRAAFVLLGLALFAEVLRAQKLSASGAARATVLGIAILALGAITVRWDFVVDRLLSIGPYLMTWGSSELDIGSRIFVWESAMSVFVGNPVFGVGFGNTGFVISESLGRGSGSQLSPHSSLFGMLADLGIVGVAMWVGLQGLGFALLARAQRSVRSEARLALIETIKISYFLYVVNGLVNVVHLDKVFWLLFAMAVAVSRLAREERVATIQAKAPS